jgi:hypothetical protein
MNDYVPCEGNRKRLEKYNRLMKLERISSDGTKVYDEGVAPKN